MTPSVGHDSSTVCYWDSSLSNEPMNHISLLLGLVLPFTLLAATKSEVRIKELASIEGIRDNQLVGYGLVVGLNGTGDRKQTVFSAQSLTNMLQQMGVAVSPAAIRVNNTAAVMITATLPPFAQPGSRIDVTASAIGDASNLQGGILIMTSLNGADGRPYAVAQGAVVTGGFVAGAAGNNQSQNHPTVGRVPNGAIVERASPTPNPESEVRLHLRRADYTTASRISQAVNERFGKLTARAESAGTVSVKIPDDFKTLSTEFIAELERLKLEADRSARVVVNERTGTIIVGKEVKISPVAILHGSLSVEIQTLFDVSQPEAFGRGQTTVTPRIDVGTKADPAKNVVLKEGASVEELVRAMMTVGSSPRDIIAILQALRTAGALEAELEVI
jgi:flagellar P-ring protein FlgI